MCRLVKSHIKVRLGTGMGNLKSSAALRCDNPPRAHRQVHRAFDIVAQQQRYGVQVVDVRCSV